MPLLSLLFFACRVNGPWPICSISCRVNKPGSSSNCFRIHLRIPSWSGHLSEGKMFQLPYNYLQLLNTLQSSSKQQSSAVRKILTNNDQKYSHVYSSCWYIKPISRTRQAKHEHRLSQRDSNFFSFPYQNR